HVARGAGGADARHSDGDTGDGEDVTTEGATQTLDHRLASDGGDWITGSPCLRRRLAPRPREIRVAAPGASARLGRRGPNPATSCDSLYHSNLESTGRP